MSKDKKYLTFYELAKEMAKEEGKDFAEYTKSQNGRRKSYLEDEFQNYRKGKQRYFEDILKNSGINKNKFKENGHYQIPIEEKEEIKCLIRMYTSPYYKKVRKGEFTTLEDKKEMIEAIKKVLSENYKGKELEENLRILYTLTSYNSHKVGEKVITNVTQLVKRTIKNVISKEDMDPQEILNKKRERAEQEVTEEVKVPDEMYDFDKFEFSQYTPKCRDLNEDEAVRLIILYKKMINNVTNNWNDIADTYVDLKEEVMDEIVWELSENEDKKREAGEVINDREWEEVFNQLADKKFLELLEEAIEIVKTRNGNS